MIYVEKCEQNAWTLQLWRRDTGESLGELPFRCRSWRHEGDCRLWKGAQDFERIREGMSQFGYWSTLTLTYDRSKHLDLDNLFRETMHHWAILRKRLQRRFKDYKYIQIWEIHRKKWPHCHIAISNQQIWRESDMDPESNFRDVMQRHAVEAGFGYVGWLEPLRSRVAYSKYLTKLAQELTGAANKSQVPVNAPKNFRRLRASAKTLAPPQKNPDIAGLLHFCTLEGRERLGKMCREDEGKKKEGEGHPN